LTTDIKVKYQGRLETWKRFYLIHNGMQRRHLPAELRSAFEVAFKEADKSGEWQYTNKIPVDLTKLAELRVSTLLVL
jgi:TRAP-type mannitol/chloroaromatic compound transport system substrate-binding protein